MIIDCVSDLHGFYPELPGGDLLIVAGDLTAGDAIDEYMHFLQWCDGQKYKKIIFIAGNHENHLFSGNRPMEGDRPFKESLIEYLIDSGTEFVYYPALTKDLPEGTIIERKKFKIWGSPWTKSFPGMNPKCKAFVVDTEEELDEKFSKIPDDIDILITHSPPRGIFDLNAKSKACGSSSLLKHINRVMPKLHVFGHIHEGYCSKEIEMHLRLSSKEKLNNFKVRFVNASHVNEYYEPVNKPIRIEL